MRISNEATPKEIEELFETIKAKKREAGEKYTPQHFINDVYLKDRKLYYRWISDTNRVKPSDQSIALMNHLAEKEGV